MNSDLRDDALAALAVLTAAMGDSEDGLKLASVMANQFASEHPKDGHNRLVGGFVQLCILLLVKIEHDTHVTPQQMLTYVSGLINTIPDDEPK